MVWETLSMGQKIGLYVFIVLAFFIFAVLSRLRFFGRTVLSLPYRILIAVLFPVIFVLLFVIGAFLVGFVFLLILALLVFTLLSGRKMHIKRIRL